MVYLFKYYFIFFLFIFYNFLNILVFFVHNLYHIVKTSNDERIDFVEVLLSIIFFMFQVCILFTEIND